MIQNHSVYCSTSWVTNIFLDFLQAVASFFAMIGSFFMKLIDYVFEPEHFKPSIKYFADNIIGNTTYNHIKDLFRYIGFSTVIILIIAGMFIIMGTGGLKEHKDSMTTIIERAIIATIMVTISMKVLNSVQDCIWEVSEQVYDLTNKKSDAVDADGNKFWTKDSDAKKSDDKEPKTKTFIEQAEEDLKAENGDSLTGGIDNPNAEDVTKKEADKKSKKSQDITADLPENAEANTAASEIILLLGFGMVVPTGALAVGGMFLIVAGVIYLICKIVMTFIIVYYYFKLVVELIRRYASFCILHIGFPAICGTIASAYTSNIFWTYLRSYVAEGICLMMTQFFIGMVSHMLHNMGVGLISTFIIVAFINIALQFENFMKELGFNISSAGGNLAEGMISSAIRVGLGVKAAKHLAGDAFVNTAALGGKNAMSFARTGSALNGKGFSDAAAINGMGNSFVGNIKENSAASGGIGMRKIDDSEVAAMNRMFQNGSRTNMDAFSSRMNSLTPGDRQKVFDNIKGSIVNGSDGKLNMSDGGFGGKFGKSVNSDSLSIKGIDGRGNLVGEFSSDTVKGNVTIGTNALNSNSMRFDTSAGNDMYMTFSDKELQTSENGINFGELVDDMSADSLKNSQFGLATNMDINEVSGFFSDASNGSFGFDNGSNPENWSYSVDKDGVETISYTGDGKQSGSVRMDTKGNYTFSFGGHAEGSLNKLVNALDEDMYEQ